MSSGSDTSGRSGAGPLRIGLTGGIGSGKSTVGAMLVWHGAALIDSDAISRAATASGGSAITPITAAFGTQVIGMDGALDRAAMRALVYRDADARQRLEAIIHPLVGASRSGRLRRPSRQARAAWCSMCLLVESGSRWRSRVDRVLVVDCPPATQIARVVARSGLAADEVQRIIDAQAPRAQRLAAADIVVHNGDDVDLATLERTIAQLARSFGL